MNEKINNILAKITAYQDAMARVDKYAREIKLDAFADDVAIVKPDVVALTKTEWDAVKNELVTLQEEFKQSLNETQQKQYERIGAISQLLSMFNNGQMSK